MIQLRCLYQRTSENYKVLKKILGMEVNFGEFVDSVSGIIYLSESVSKYSFKKPDDVKEVMVSSRVEWRIKHSALIRLPTWTLIFMKILWLLVESVSVVLFLQFPEVPFVDYRYKLEGSYLENGRWVNKIAVIPKRKNDPVFAGYIYIQDSTWRIHSTDLISYQRFTN